MAALVVLLEQILAEVAAEIPPHGVNVIGVVLRIIQLNQERGCLNAVIMWIPAIDAP